MSSPTRANVPAEISFYAAVEAVEYFAANYPADRAATNNLCEASPFVKRLRAAADLLDQRATDCIHSRLIAAPLPAGVPDTPKVREALQTLVETPGVKPVLDPPKHSLHVNKPCAACNADGCTYWDADRGNGFNSRGYAAGRDIYYDPMG